LSFLLNSFSKFGATDSRDKVYGLLGLAKEIQQQDQDSAIMVPDYTKSLATVYTETAKFIILKSGRLDILRSCDGLGRTPGLPSWAPDWSCNIHRPTNQVNHQIKPYDLSPGLFPDSYSQPVAEFCKNPARMIVRGFIIGALVDSGTVLFTFPEHSLGQRFDEISHGIADLAMKYLAPNITWLIKRGIFGLFAKLVLRIVIRLAPDIEPRLSPYLNLIDDMVLEIATDLDANHNEETLIPKAMDNIFGSGDELQLEETSCRSLTWTPLFKTITLEPGNCTTFAPDPRGGDFVCLLRGSSEGRILRAVDDHYILVGTVDFGIFTRYLWRDCEREFQEGTILLQDFTLR
jgi:hypothetical protein